MAFLLQALLKRSQVSDHFKRDMATLRSLHNNHITEVRDVFANTAKFFVVMELAEGGSLQQLIDTDGMFTEPKARYYFRQLIDGIRFCHNHGFYFGDLNSTVCIFH